MDVDYNKLKSFLAVVKCGSVTVAAQELGRTQSAVSQSVKGLEKHLDLKLIEWEGKRLKLTRSGELVYQAVATRMAVIDRQLAAIADAGGEVAGHIDIGVLQDNSTPYKERLYALIAEYRKRYPAVTFALHFGTSRELEQALLKRKIDVGFLINFQERHRFEVVDVLSEEHLLVASQSYIEACGPFKGPEDLIKATLMDIDPHFTCLIPWLDKHAPEVKTELNEGRPQICAPDFTALKSLVQLGQGIAILPRHLIASELKEGSLKRLFLKLSPLQVSVDCAIERGREVRLCEQRFLELVSQQKRDYR